MKTMKCIICLVTMLILCSFANGGAIGNPTVANGWDTTSAVSVVTSSGQGSVGAEFVYTINGVGLDAATGTLHGPVKKPGMGWADGTVNPRGGTINDGTYGDRWIEYSFDQVFNLDTMDIWAYNENGRGDWGCFTVKTCTIQVSTTGSTTNSAEWTTVGNYNLSLSPSSSMPATDSIDFSGIAAKYVVITLINGWEGTYAKGNFGLDNPSFGLSEVRFNEIPEPATMSLLGLAGLLAMKKRRCS